MVTKRVRQRRINAAIALLIILAIVSIACYLAWLVHIVLYAILVTASLAIIINFPWHKFK